MKTYRIKNYKGNILESLSKFQRKHKGVKIVEACEDGKELKIKAQESTGDPGEEMLDVDQVAFESLKEIIDILMAGGAVYYALDGLNDPDENERKKFYQTCYDFFSKIVNNEDYVANNGDDEVIRNFKEALKGLKQ